MLSPSHFSWKLRGYELGCGEGIAGDDLSLPCALVYYLEAYGIDSGWQSHQISSSCAFLNQASKASSRFLSM